MKQYPSYKSSGVEWIGEMPEHWEIKRISHVSDLLTGFAFKSELFSFSTGTKLVRGDNVTEGEVRWGDKTRYWKNPTAELDRFYLSEDDIVIGMDGSKVGKNYAMIQKAELPLLLVQRVARIRSGSKELQNWIFCWIGSQLFRNHVDYVRTDPAIPHITLKDIGDFKITVPSHDELKTIVSYIAEKTSLIDETIRKKQQLIELLQEERTAIINQAVTRGLNQDVKLKPSGVEWLGDVPEHWEVKKLKYIISCNDNVLTETTDPNMHIEYVEISDVQYGRGITNTTSYLFKVAPSRARRLVKDGDVIVSTVRTYLRAIAQINKPHPNLVVSTGFAVLRPLTLSSCFLSFLFESRLVDEVVKISKGVSYPATTSPELTNIKVPIPPISEQESICKYLKGKVYKMEEAFERITKEISLLQEYRTALINEVVTGKRCVVPVNEEVIV